MPLNLHGYSPRKRKGESGLVRMMHQRDSALPDWVRLFYLEHGADNDRMRIPSQPLYPQDFLPSASDNENARYRIND